jgi:hypothetical protein
VLGYDEHTPTALSMKKFKENVKYQKISHNPDNYIKYPYKNIKIPSGAKLILSLLLSKCQAYITSSKVKDIFTLYK